MREFFKIWLTLIGIGFACIAVVSAGITLFTNSFFWGILYFGVVATGILALMIYLDIHKYD